MARFNNSGWQSQTNDLEEDFVNSFSEDEVDGCFNIRPAMIARDMASKAKPFFPPGGSHPNFSSSLYRNEKPVFVAEKCDSGVENSFDSIPHDEYGRISSIGDVDNTFERLSIKPKTHTVHSQQDETQRIRDLLYVKQDEHNILESIDEAYYSGETTGSGPCPVVINQFFCEQDDEGDSEAHLFLIHKRTDQFLHHLCCVKNSSMLNIQNNLQQSLMHLAVILQLPQVVRKLVARGAEIDLRDRRGNTPLHIACKNGDLDCVLSLTTPLEPGEIKDFSNTYPYRRIPQDQDVMNYDGLTCLHLAAEIRSIQIVNHLVSKCNANINAQEGRGGETILHQAVENNSLDLVKYLLLHRELNLETTRYDGSSALLLAIGRKMTNMTNLLLNAGAIDSSYDSCSADLKNSSQEDSTRFSSSSDESMEEDSNRETDINDDFTYDDFRIGGSLLS